MERIYNFLKEAGTYFIATVDGDTPKVRPFGTIDMYNGKLGIQTGKVKDFYKQVEKNPKVEICAMRGGEWIRVEGEVYPDDSVDACEHMLLSYENLRSIYTPGDGNCVVLYFKSGKAVISSFTAAPVTICF